MEIVLEIVKAIFHNNYHINGRRIVYINLYQVQLPILALAKLDVEG